MSILLITLLFGSMMSIDTSTKVKDLDLVDDVHTEEIIDTLEMREDI